jgi:carbonic anhydrase
MIFAALSLPLLVVSYGIHQFEQHEVDQQLEAAPEFDSQMDGEMGFDGEASYDAVVEASNVHGKPEATGEEAVWSYSGATGPNNWGDLHPAFETCKTGKMQSPVDLSDPSSKAEVKEDIAQPMWSNVTLAYLRKIPGRTLKIEIPPRNPNSTHIGRDGKPGYPQKVTYEGKDYRLTGIRFRSPAGHVKNGKKAPFSMQMRHKVKLFDFRLLMDRV